MMSEAYNVENIGKGLTDQKKCTRIGSKCHSHWEEKKP